MPTPIPQHADRFPRSARYHPDWIREGMGSASNALWLTEWLCEKMELKPGMRVLDLGCGKAISSVFLHREYGVQVWAADLWFHPGENWQRIRDAGVADQVFPMRLDARSLPFAPEFFDAILSIDAFMYFGTDDYYLPSLARFLKPGGALGIALSGWMRETHGSVPEHLQSWWSQDQLWSLHTVDWWKHHWAKTGLMDIECADQLSDGWRYWLDSLRVIAPDNHVEISALEADEGRNLGYVRLVARRRTDATIHDPIETIPVQYEPNPPLL